MGEIERKVWKVDRIDLLLVRDTHTHLKFCVHRSNSMRDMEQKIFLSNAIKHEKQVVFTYIQYVAHIWIMTHPHITFRVPRWNGIGDMEWKVICDRHADSYMLTKLRLKGHKKLVLKFCNRIQSFHIKYKLSFAFISLDITCHFIHIQFYGKLNIALQQMTHLTHLTTLCCYYDLLYGMQAGAFAIKSFDRQDIDGISQ